MTLKKMMAGPVLAASLTLGTAAAAHAAEDPARTRPTAEQLCSRVQSGWQKLTGLDQRIHEHYRKMQEARSRAQAAGKADAVAKIDARLAKVEGHHARLETKMHEVRDKAAGRCELSGGEPTPL